MIKPALYLLGLLGTLQLWGRTVVDGTLAHLLSALHGPSQYRFPGTKIHLNSFTRVLPVDYFLSILVVFFWEVADGSHPASSAIGLYFLGQFFSIVTIVYLEHLRLGASPGFVRSASYPSPIFPQGRAFCGGLIKCNLEQACGFYYSRLLV
jgi:hypothetical protein